MPPIVVLDDLPLIDVSELKLPDPVVPSTYKDPAVSTLSDSYWDWGTNQDALIQRMQEEEKIRSLLSASMKLIQKSKRRAVDSVKEEGETSSEDSHDDYWNMPATVMEDEFVSQGDAPIIPSKIDASRISASYWNWPSVKCKEGERMAHRVLEEERAHRLTSSAFYERSLVAEATQTSTGATSLEKAHDFYWVC